MSATGRSDVRRSDDYYRTPSWCVDRLLEALPLTAGLWLEPAVGDGSIVHAVNKSVTSIQWDAIDIRQECRGQVSTISSFVCRDFVSNDRCWPTEKIFDVAITNPPFSLAIEYVSNMLKLAKTVIVLTRLNFLSSDRRSKFFINNMPDVYVLPNRPSFTEDGRTDATEYCWLVWKDRGRFNGSIKVLNQTPVAERTKK